MLMWSGVSQETRTPRTQAHATTRSPWRRVALGALVLLAIAVAGVWTYWRFFVASPVTTHQASRPIPLVAQVHFVTSDTGWVGVVQPTGGAVLATADGGRRWRSQLALPGMQPRWIHFFDAGRGFVFASSSAGPGKPDQLYRTADGGAQWAPVGLPAPSTLYSSGAMLSFADEQHGWYLLPAYSYPESQDFTLYTTGDGGTTWTPLLSADIGHPLSHGMSYTGRKTGLWFRDWLTGWVGQAGQGQASLWFTSDGGSDWEEERLPAPPAGWNPSAQVLVGVPAVFPDGTGAVVAATVGPASAGPPTIGAFTYTTTDGGRTWADPRPLPQASSAGASFLGPSSVAIRSGRQWWYGAGSVLYVTEDAGDHWREVGSAPRGSSFTSIQGVDGSHAWAIATRFTDCRQAGPCGFGPTELVRIDDGGRHLSVVKLPAGSG
jgi:photosystem II stability/assembly factor-like uncharacterized protein